MRTVVRKVRSGSPGRRKLYTSAPLQGRPISRSRSTGRSQACFKSITLLYLLIIRPSEVAMQIAAITYISTHDTWIIMLLFLGINCIFIYNDVTLLQLHLWNMFESQAGRSHQGNRRKRSYLTKGWPPLIQTDRQQIHMFICLLAGYRNSSRGLQVKFQKATVK